MKKIWPVIVIVLVSGAILFYLMQVKDQAPAPARANDGTENEIYDGDCAPEGSASEPRLKELNKYKNRSSLPLVTNYNDKVTLNAMLEAGDDRDRWNNNMAATISGYVADVMPGGVETCNCKTKERDHRDTHIEIVKDAMNGRGIDKVIVEVTPRIREIMAEKGIDWSTAELRKHLLGRKVTFKGWMMYDFEHERQAENTNPGNPKNWRGTAWEIHPVVSIQINDDILSQK